MKKYQVYFARTTWLVATVEAEDEDSAIEEAYEVLPGFSAHESGWGSTGWSADADEWLPINEFYWKEYDEEKHGPVVEEIEA